MKVNTLRQYWKKATEFDAWLTDLILLKPKVPEDHGIWVGFQNKFAVTMDLVNYGPFFEKILYRISKDFIKEMVTVVEYRHIFGCLKDDDLNVIPLKEELEIFHRVEKAIRQMFPLFRMKIINCGLKIVGKPHIQYELDACIESAELSEMVTAFDMVNEEDYNPPIDHFLEQMLEAK